MMRWDEVKTPFGVFSFSPDRLARTVARLPKRSEGNVDGVQAHARTTFEPCLRPGRALKTSEIVFHYMRSPAFIYPFIKIRICPLDEQI